MTLIINSTMSIICCEEVLELNADFSDFSSDEEKVVNIKAVNHERLLTATELNERIWLKFFRKGKASVLELRDDLLKLLVHVYNLTIDGIFFVDQSIVLVEMVLDNSARNFLLFIYEERLGNKIVKKKPINKIEQLCDGKFFIPINNTVLSLVILLKTNLIRIPCKSHASLYGLSNGGVINLESESFYVDKRFNVYECLLTLQGELNNNLDCFIGILLEVVDEIGNFSRLIFSFKLGLMSNTLLIKLKKIFGTMYFSSSTIHLLPINDSASNSGNCDLFLEFNSSTAFADSLYPLSCLSLSSDIGNANTNFIDSHFRNTGSSNKRRKRHSLLYK